MKEKKIENVLTTNVQHQITILVNFIKYLSEI